MQLATPLGQSVDTINITAVDDRGRPIVGASVSMVVTKMVVKSDPWTKTSTRVPVEESLVTHTNEAGSAILELPSQYAEGIKAVTIRKPGHQTITAEVDPRRTPPFTVTMKRMGLAINWPVTLAASGAVIGLIWFFGRGRKR